MAVVAVAMVSVFGASVPMAAGQTAETIKAPIATAQAAVVAQPRASLCRIGKPSYCYKYGGNRCPKTNTLGVSSGAIEKNCEAWTEACLACHLEIPDCIGRPRPAADSLKCGNCREAWGRCMDGINAKFWPNRKTLN